MTPTITVNGRTYRLPPVPIAVVCIDGCSDEYLDAAIARGRMPHVQRMSVAGHRARVRAALPSFTNVNNCAIVTGTPPRDTGISGNYILDPATGQEVMTNSPAFLRNQTVLSAAARAGRRVAMVTAKDKLRELLSKDLEGISFSAERGPDVHAASEGWSMFTSFLGPPPPIYSAEASLFVLRAGAHLLQSQTADFLYLTTTDYMQHRFEPTAGESIAFYAQVDELIGQLLVNDTIVAITADHGMNAKCTAAGTPQVLYLETELAERFGPGYRVICPITDPYVAHHGALGSAVTVYLPADAEPDRVARWILEQQGVTDVYDRLTAAAKLELPADRIGDLFVLAGRDWVIGRAPVHHDLSQLEGPLRSHGGRYEEMVPVVLSHPLNGAGRIRANGDPRNFDVFDFACNGVVV